MWMQTGSMMSLLATGNNRKEFAPILTSSVQTLWSWAWGEQWSIYLVGGPVIPQDNHCWLPTEVLILKSNGWVNPPCTPRDQDLKSQPSVYKSRALSTAPPSQFSARMFRRCTLGYMQPLIWTGTTFHKQCVWVTSHLRDREQHLPITHIYTETWESVI